MGNFQPLLNKHFILFLDDSLLQIDTDDFLKFMEALVVELSMND